jgi:predicted nuclease of predicted toxin-antitoxin system
VSVKLLVDVHLSPDWVPYLKAAGVESVHWSEIGPLQAPDAALMEWARESGYVVFTHDLDFGAMLALTGADGPSVIQLRGRGVLPTEGGETLVRAIKTVGADLEAGALVIVNEATKRVRILPLSP